MGSIALDPYPYHNCDGLEIADLAQFGVRTSNLGTSILVASLLLVDCTVYCSSLGTYPPSVPVLRKGCLNCAAFGNPGPEDILTLAFMFGFSAPLLPVRMRVRMKFNLTCPVSCAGQTGRVGRLFLPLLLRGEFVSLLTFESSST